MLSTRTAVLALLLSAAAFLISVYLLAPQLPEGMATHFDAAGQANGWMSPGQHIVFVVSLGLGFPTVLCGILFFIRFLPKFQDLPHAAEILFRWSLWTGALHIIWTALLNERMVAANRLPHPEFAPVPAFILAGVYVAGAVFLIGVLAFTLAKDKKDIQAS